jgi:hypothetical protein
VILAQLLSLIVEAWVGPLAQRPRPFGVVIRAGWGGWALPSVQLTFLAAGLVMSLYTLVPEGRWRNNGKWVATGWVALAALGRIALGAEARGVPETGRWSCCPFAIVDQAAEDIAAVDLSGGWRFRRYALAR